jgi:hypothetical protein
MAKPDLKESIFTPAEAMERLTQIPFAPDRTEADDPLRKTELMQAVLNIAGMNHVSESDLVRHAVKNAIGTLPGPEE